MTAAHFIYIPGVVILGFVIGYILGGRAALGAAADKADRDRRRRAQRAREDA